MRRLIRPGKSRGLAHNQMQQPPAALHQGLCLCPRATLRQGTGRPIAARGYPKCKCVQEGQEVISSLRKKNINSVLQEKSHKSKPHQDPSTSTRMPCIHLWTGSGRISQTSIKLEEIATRGWAGKSWLDSEVGAVGRASLGAARLELMLSCTALHIA